MSTSDASQVLAPGAARGGTARPVARAPRGLSTRLLRSELRLVFGRRRNQALLVALACVPVLIPVAIRIASGNGGGGGGGRGGAGGGGGGRGRAAPRFYWGRSPATGSSWRSRRSS